MRELADELYQLRGVPRNAFNIYLIGDVLIDSGTRHAKNRILEQLKGRSIAAHTLTHAHPDHQGSSSEICNRFDIPLWCGANEVEAMETGALVAGVPDNRLTRWIAKAWSGPPHPVSRHLREGDEVAGFTVLDAPGHTLGQVAYWRESDRALILGDVLANVNLLTGKSGLMEPPKLFSRNLAQNRDSARKLAELEPKLVCFGHGPPLRDTRKFVDFVGSLP